MKKIIVLLALALAAEGSVYAAVPIDPPPPGSDAGAVLNQSREFFRRQEITRELEEEKNRVKDGADVKQEEPKKEVGEDIRFVLTDVQFTPSSVLTAEELAAITAPYLNQSVSIQDLYKIVDAVNSIYNKKGYVTCRAGLPPQTIAKGVVKIELWEGKVGRVEVKENATTNEQYIKKRLPLTPDSIVSLDELNRALLWFNGTNDVQLRIQLQAGSEPGTTDYVITASEPQRVQLSLFADNSGSETSGLWRSGANYISRSANGKRDQLSIGAMFSKGTRSGSISYSTPFTDKGARLGLYYSANTVKTIKGPLSEMDTRGSSNGYGLSLTQPLSVSKARRMEAGFEWSRQNSETKFMGMRWADDNIDRYSALLTVTNYGQRHVLYQRHSYSFGTWTDIDDVAKNFGKYQFSGVGQTIYGGGQIFTARFNGQITSTNYLPSSEQFFIGGVYSVRGYRENLLGADNGYSLSLEYAMPVERNREWFLFVDSGGVSGDNALDDHMLTAAGCGYRISFDKSMTASLTLGVPFRKDINGERISKTRLHAVLNGQL